MLLTGGGGGQGAAGLFSKVNTPVDLIIPKRGLGGHQETDDSKHLLPSDRYVNSTDACECV